MGIYHPSAKVLGGEAIDHLDQVGAHGEEAIGHPLVKELVGVVIDHPWVKVHDGAVIVRPWQEEGHGEEVNHQNTSLLAEVERPVEEANLYVLGVRRTSFLEVAIDVVVVKVIEIH